MPELPEVEVLMRHLARVLTGMRIARVTVPKARLIRPHLPGGFAQALAGATVVRVTRRAKYLVFDLEGAGKLPGVATPCRLIAHLGMTGRMALLPADDPIPRHAAVILGLGQGTWVFEDPRGFGRMTLDASVLDGLGPEPLDPEFTAEVLARGLTASRQPIKTRLLDQRIVVGLGNIYAAEALFRAGVSPRRPSHRLRPMEVRHLHGAIRDVLAEAVSFGSSLPLAFMRDGMSASEPLFYFGRIDAGDPASPVEERFNVYDREGKPCRLCATPIRRIAQAGRSSYYCPRCQH